SVTSVIMSFLSHTLLVHLVDWKRSKKISRDSYVQEDGSRLYGKGPCSYLQDANGWHYVLQLNLYKMLVEANYDMKVLSMSNLVFHPDNDSYIEYDIE